MSGIRLGLAPFAARLRRRIPGRGDRTDQLGELGEAPTLGACSADGQTEDVRRDGRRWPLDGMCNLARQLEQAVHVDWTLEAELVHQRKRPAIKGVHASILSERLKETGAGGKA